ncbi:actin-like protein ARP6 [Schizopora paradoxa]|uniref:Actin-like protein ARP6 n=1 Tax=Schizopora paradoxa TaxID=27342 RepID=A0A0H2RN55_9AGAM|nr:actin-like protein ARP6 [Schizopora paradoxa]
MPSPPVVVLDNGGSTIKAGVVVPNSGDDVDNLESHGVTLKPRTIVNAVIRSKGDKKTYFGHELEQCRDFSSLHYRLPFERGFLTDWDAQKAVWDGLFSQLLKVEPADHSLLITEPYFNLPNIQDVYDQFVFEEYEFQSYLRCAPAALLPFGSLFGSGLPAPECMLIVDSGFSFTHIVPLMNGKVLWKSVRRLDVGGKLMTNHLKELVSFRQWNMMDETHIVNDVKEKCCYVTAHFGADLETCRKDPKRNEIVQEYVLPNFADNRPGRVKAPIEVLAEGDQVLVMNNERFAVPELLFRPTDIGLSQSGISRTIAEAISTLPQDVQGLFWANIGLVGGNVKFPGFRQRLADELRSLAPIQYEVHIHESSDPIVESWLAGAAFARREPSVFSQHVVTRAEYQEGGSNACRRKFPGWMARAGSNFNAGEQNADSLAEVHGDAIIATTTGRRAKADARMKASTRGKARAKQGG